MSTLRSPNPALDTILIKTPKEFWQIRDQTKSMQKRLAYWLKLVLSQGFTEIVIRWTNFHIFQVLIFQGFPNVANEVVRLFLGVAKRFTMVGKWQRDKTTS